MMKKLILFLIFTLTLGHFSAQYSTLNSILEMLEEKKGINQDLKNINIDDKKFIFIKNFDDHDERYFVVLKGNTATFVEIFDDKTTGESSSNVFTGDVARSNKNIISIRCDRLEGQKIAIPDTKTFFLTKQRKIIYLVDITTKDRWIDEKSFGKEK